MMRESFPKREKIATFVLISSVSLVVAYIHFRMIDLPNLPGRSILHYQILCGTAPSPYRYRILVPFLTEILIRATSLFTSPPRSFLLSYVVYDFCAVWFSLSALFLFLRQWFSLEQALVGVLFTAAMMPFSFKDHIFQPWSLLEPGLFSLGLTGIFRKWHRMLLLLVILAALNKETSVFIPLAFLFANLDIKGANRRNLILAIFYFTAWLAIFLGLRFLEGWAPHIRPIPEIWRKNTSPPNLLKAVGYNILFFGPFWFFVILGFRTAPQFIRRVALIVPFYLLAIFIFGVWFETRLLMPLYPIFISLGLSYCFRKGG